LLIAWSGFAGGALLLNSHHRHPSAWVVAFGVLVIIIGALAIAIILFIILEYVMDWVMGR
jgi:hypothetical protein